MKKKANCGQIQQKNGFRPIKCKRVCNKTHGEYSAHPSDAGWSSPVARRAHNPKVVGSNPAPQPTDAALAVFVFGFDNKVLYGRGVEQPGSSSGS